MAAIHIKTAFLERSEAELVLELAKYISKLAGEITKSTEEEGVLPATGPTMERYQGLIAQHWTHAIEPLIVDSASILSSGAQEKEVEGAFHLLFVLLSKHEHLSGKWLSALLQVLLADSRKSVARFRLVNNLFNVCGQGSRERYQVYQTIVEYAAAIHRADTLLAHLPHLPGWINAWSLKETEKRELLSRVGEVLSEEGFPSESFQLHMDVLNSYGKEFNTEIPEEMIPTLCSRVIKTLMESIRHPRIFVFDGFLNLPYFSSIFPPSSEIYNLLQLLVHASTMHDCRDFVESHQTFLQSTLGVTTENLMDKLRLLTLCQVASEHLSQSTDVPFEVIADRLDISVSDVERFVIDGIRLGCIDAKVDQLRQTVTISRTTLHVFEDSQWQKLDSLLDFWKHKVGEVISVIQNTRMTTLDPYETAPQIMK